MEQMFFLFSSKPNFFKFWILKKLLITNCLFRILIKILSIWFIDFSWSLSSSPRWLLWSRMLAIGIQWSHQYLLNILIPLIPLNFALLYHTLSIETVKKSSLRSTKYNFPFFSRYSPTYKYFWSPKWFLFFREKKNKLWV